MTSKVRLTDPIVKTPRFGNPEERAERARRRDDLRRLGPEYFPSNPKLKAEKFYRLSWARHGWSSYRVRYFKTRKNANSLFYRLTEDDDERYLRIDWVRLQEFSGTGTWRTLGREGE